MVSVAIGPGAIAVSLMPKRAHSIDRTRVRFSTAARAADEWAMPGRPWCGESVTFTILPPSAGIIAFVATAWVISQVPIRFRRTTVSKPFDVMSSAGVMYWPPALLTRTSILPWRSSTSSTSAFTWSSSRMSQGYPCAVVSQASTVSSSGSCLRPATTTVAPSALSSSAVARPRPEPPPVTTATCPSSRFGANIREGTRGRLTAAAGSLAPVIAEAQPAQLPLPGGRQGATVKLHPLLTGEIPGPAAWLAREEGRMAGAHALGIGVDRSDFIPMPVPAFLVEHPGAGPLMIDTGLHPSAAVDPKQNFGRLLGFAARGLEMTSEQPVPAQLRARGLDAADIRVVLMTHMHFDHASAISEFPQATFVLSKQEWDALEDAGWTDGYVKSQYDFGFDYRTFDFDS